MPGKIVTLYIDNTQIKLLVTSGKHIKKMAELPLDLGSAKIKPAIKEAEIASKINQLLKAKKVNASKIILGISGMHCLTRPFTIPQLPKAIQEEALMREAKRVLPIPPEQLHISWQLFPGLEEGQSRGFLVGIPRRIADVYLKVLEQVGLKPYLLDLKPLALTRMLEESTAMLLDIQALDFDIVIQVSGIPQPVRTVAFASESLSQEEKLAAVSEELAKTIEFYNSNNPENPMSPETPLYVSGELDDFPDLFQTLTDSFGYPLKQLISPLKCPKELDAAHYLVNIGLAMKELVSEKKGEPARVNINALPESYRPKPFPLMKFLTLPVALAVIAVLFMMVTFIQDASANIASARTQLDTTEQIIKTKQSQKEALTGEVATLKKKISQANTSRKSLVEAKEAVDRRGEIINEDLATVTRRLITGMTLGGVSHSGGNMSIRGNADSEAEVLSYARSLDESGRFSEVTITRISRVPGQDGDDSMNFILALKTGPGGGG